MSFWADLLNKSSAFATPPSISGYTGTYLGNGLVHYTRNALMAMTGSAQTDNFIVPKPHRLLRYEVTQFVTSTGAKDTTGINLILQKLNYSLGNIGANQASTNGSSAVATVIFQFDSDGYPNDQGTYVTSVTGQNNDEISVEFWLKYVVEAPTSWIENIIKRALPKNEAAAQSIPEISPLG